MTPFVRWVRRQWERLLGVWEEGIEPPERIERMVTLFANANPRATRAEWAAFAAYHAQEAYRTGYVRGLERSERDPEVWNGVDPEAFADAVTPGWRRSPPVVLEEPDLPVRDEEETEAETLKRQLAALRRGR